VSGRAVLHGTAGLLAPLSAIQRTKDIDMTLPLPSPNAAQLLAIEKERIALAPEVNARFLHRPRHEGPVPEGHVLLRRAPVWVASTDIQTQGGYASRTHTVCVVGDVGKGVYKSGLAYYSLRSDPKRSGMTLDAEYMNEVRQARDRSGQPAFAAPVLDALEAMGECSFHTREAFFKAYVDQRLRQVPVPSNEQLKQVRREYDALAHLVPKHRWEVWPQAASGLPPRREGLTPEGEPAAPGNWSEQDVRKLERTPKGIDADSGKTFLALAPAQREDGRVLAFDDVSLRTLPNVDPLGVLEAHRHVLLHRLCVDQIAGRNGSTYPMMKVDRLSNPIDPSDVRKAMQALEHGPWEWRDVTYADRTPRQVRAALSKVATYQLYPEYGPDKGNCNSATSTFLHLAGARPEDIKSPSAYNYGFRHTLSIWQPLGPASASPPPQGSTTAGAIDTSTSRGSPVRTAEIAAALAKGPSALVMASRAARPAPP
jgi:hypothetical protein